MVRREPPAGLTSGAGGRRRIRRISLAVIAGAALLVSCGSNGEGGSGPAAPGGAPPASETTTTTAAPVPTYPLSGLPVTDPAQAAKPALVIKIDNVDQPSRPQAGINQADIVYEEKIEGPISRFAAVYQSTEVELVGPVRSGRSTDVAIVSTLNTPLYAFSGANEVFAKQLREAPLVYISHDNQPKLFDRRPGRPAPDNVFTSTERLRAQTPEGAQPPVPQLTYRLPTDPLPADAVDVVSFNYDFGGGPVGQPVTFTWDAAANGWGRTQKGTPHVDNDGALITPTNVIVQFVPYRDTGLVDLSRTPVPEAVLVGTGSAWVFVGGKAINATWTKPDEATLTTFTDAEGKPIALNPGRTWIALVPNANAGFAAQTAAGTTIT